MSDPALTLRCPEDGGRMPLVGRRQRPGRRLVRLFWCRYCEFGLAVVGEPSGSVAARFTLDDKTATITVTGSLHRDDVDEAVTALGRRLYDRLKRKP